MYAPKNLPFDLRRVTVDLVRESDGMPWMYLAFDVQGEFDPDSGVVLDSLAYSNCRVMFDEDNAIVEPRSKVFAECFADSSQVQNEIVKLACCEVGLEYRDFVN